MTRISPSTTRLLVAGLLAGIGGLSLSASEPLRGLDTLRRLGRTEAPSPISGAEVYDLHMLRVTLTDGVSLLSGITVASGDRRAVTDENGQARLVVRGVLDAPLSLTDSAGTTIGGSIRMPATRTEGVDALVFVDGVAGSFDAVTAGDVGPERAEYTAALRALEQEWESRGMKEERPATSLFDGTLDVAAPSPGDAAAPVLAGRGFSGAVGMLQQQRAERIDVISQDATPATSLRRNGGGRLRGVTPVAEASELLVPADDFSKAGWELLEQHAFMPDGTLTPKAAAQYEELLAGGLLTEEQAMTLGAELLRQGVDLEPVLASTVRDAVAAAGIQQSTGLSVHSGGAPTVGGTSGVTLPGDDPHVMIVDGFEPDNTIATCGNIPTDGTQQERGIDPAGDLDYICFFANCGDVLHIETGSAAIVGSSTDTVLDLYDPDGLLIASDDQGAPTLNWSAIDIVADKTGTHVVKVRGFSTTTLISNYKVWVTATPGTCDPTLDDSEPNDSFAGCSPKAADGSYTTHHLRPLGDEDWFCFNVAECGSTITFDQNEFADTDITASIAVYSPSNVQVGTTTTSLSPVNVSASEPGTYRIRVWGNATPSTAPNHDNSADNNTGMYALSISTAPPSAPCDTFEPDNVRDACNSVPTDGTVVPGHSIAPQDDVDWYCFDLGCNDSVSITVTPTPTGVSTSLRPQVELWFPASNATTAIVTGTSTGGGVPVTISRAANHAGRWYARVVRASAATGSSQTGTYNIAVTATPGAPSPMCDSYETDSSPSQCRTPIDMAGTRESKAIFPLRDEDWICLGSLQCGDAVTIQTWATPPADQAVDTYIEIFKLPNYLTTGDRVAFDDDSGDDQFSLVSYALTNVTQNGTYVAKVRGFSTTSTGSQGPYDVAVIKTSGDCPEPDAFEPDGTQATCTPLPGPALTGHNIFPSTDADFYCVDFACGQNLDVTVTPTGGSLRPIVALLGPTGTVIQTITSPSSGTPVTLSTTDNAAGPHSIRVTSSTSTTGNYTISSTTSMGTCLFDPHEPPGGDNTSATCRFVGLPTTESRSLSPNTDTDYYCLSLDCGEGINVTVTPTSGTLRAIIRLREQDGTTLTTVTATAAGDPVTLNDAVSAGGVYTIEVDSSTSTQGLYDISLSRFNAFNCIDAYENDDTRDTCRPIPTDGTVQDHTLLLHPDEDWVCFEVAECGTRVLAETLQASPMYDDADPTMSLWGPDGTMIVSATGGGSPSTHARINRLLTEPGTYALRIVPSSTSATSTSGGQYGLRVTATDVRREPIVPPATQTLLPDATQLDAQALTMSSGYTMIPGANPFIEIHTTGTPLGADGLSAHPVAIPFTFTYYGNPYNVVNIQDNGLITFSNPEWIPGIANDCIPDIADPPNDYVAAFYEDLQQGTGGSDIFVETRVIGGQQVFIAEWYQSNVPGDGNATLEVLLWENGDIEFRYAPTMTSIGDSATVGIENPDGTDGIQFSCNTAFSFAGTSLLFSAATGLVPYPDNPSCYEPYDVVTDTGAFFDISSMGAPVTFTGNTATATVSDNGHASVALPFTFPYFGVGETGLIVHTNGFVSFSAPPTATTDTNTCTFPGTATPNGVLAAFWDDLNVVGTSGVYTLGVDPSPDPGDAFFVIQWDEVPFYATATTGTGANTFQIVLFEDGRIEYRYDAMTASTRGSGNSATIGLENRAGTDGYEYSCNTANSVMPGDRISFIPTEPPPRFTWIDPATGDVLATGPTYLHPIDGVCEVLLRVEVRDPISCCVMTREELITIADRAAPTITRQPSFGTNGCMFLWPPNHGYVDFSLADAGLEAFDACNPFTVRFSASASGSTQSEDESGTGDGGSLDDLMISPDGQTISLRAERNGGCSMIDRSYDLYLEVTDAAGNTVLSEPFQVCVWHDQGGTPPGDYRSAPATSDSDDTRPGWIEGSYGSGCGTGCSMSCDPTQELP